MKKRIIALLLSLVMLTSLLTPTALATEGQEPETSQEETVPPDQGGRVVEVPAEAQAGHEVTVEAPEEGESYQWQFQLTDDLWVSISGDEGRTIALTYAKICNMLDENGEARLRCLVDGQAGEPYTVVLTESQDVSQDETLDEIPDEIPDEISAEEDPVPEEDPVLADASEVAIHAVKSAAIGAAALTENEEELTEGEEADTSDTYSIVINYVFADGTPAAPSWTATVAAGTTYQQEIKSPVVLGYTPDQDTVNVDASGEMTYTVTYSPAEVNYTVKHWQQNVNNDEYELAETETKTGYTEAAVGGGLAKAYEGFYSLLYDTTTKIAADGSTEVNVYYDRYYYLMRFDLDGGYGVEPIYARYGAKIEVGEPTKPGYTFVGWDNTPPSTMPAENKTYTAQWEVGQSGFTVVFWYENADDEGYSVAGTYKPADVAPGTEKKSGDYKDQNFTGRDTAHFTYNRDKAETVTVSGDGSTVLNVYFTRNFYTLKFRELDCDKWFMHSHSDSCYKTVKTITAKYGADIHGNFPINDSKGNTILWSVPSGCESFKPGTYLASINTMPGENITFSVYDQVSAATIWYYVEALNGETGTHNYSGKHFILYKSVKYTKSGYLTYAEEFHDIIGFKQWASDPEFSSFDQNGKTSTIKDNNYLYYTRNSYNLKFYNYNAYVDGKGGSVQYEAPLSSYYFEPEYPANLEKNAYVFDGWYTTAGCYEGSKADMNTMTMPASDVILYAKWTPKTHMVRTYLTKDAMNNAEAALNTWDAVPHGTAATPKAETPKNGEYEFVGWFYISDTGTEKAFDFSMPVNRDLNLYAKWSSNKLVEYTICYQLEDGTGIAAPTTGSALAGTTKTFDAKTGTQLNEGYQSGYFPKTASHSLTIDIEGTAENKLNEFIFVYVPKTEVNYTVRYLEKDTNAVLHEGKQAATRDAVITEKFEQINGYAPDAYQKRLVLSADEDQNVITFWYVKDEVHAPVQIIHWTQKIAGDGYTEYQSSTDLNGVIGQTYSETSLTIPGFTYNRGKSNASGTLTAEGLVLNLYYDRIEYPYEFRFREQGTETELADPITGSARFGAQVTQAAKTIPGYKLVSGVSENQAITIAIEDPADEASKNVKTFYYVEDTVDIKYQVVGPTGSGALDNYQDNGIGVLTGDSLKGSTPTAAEGFRFVGWFKDEACTHPVNGSWVANNKLTPDKTKNYGTNAAPAMGYEAATYYAKFEYDVADLTISKQGCEDIDENQSFIFTVTGGDLPDEGLKVVVKGNGSVTIKGLKVGTTYTITEDTGWSWRYTPKTEEQKKTLDVDKTKNIVTFTNERKEGKWLNGCSIAVNFWESKEKITRKETPNTTTTN